LTAQGRARVPSVHAAKLLHQVRRVRVGGDVLLVAVAGQRQAVRTAPSCERIEKTLVESLGNRLPVSSPNGTGVRERVVQQGGQLGDQIVPSPLAKDVLEAERPREGRGRHRARLIIEDGGDLLSEEPAVALGILLVGQLDESASRLRAKVIDHGIAAVVERAGVAAETAEEDKHALLSGRHGPCDRLAVWTHLSPRLARNRIACRPDEAGYDSLKTLHHRLGGLRLVDREVTRTFAFDELVIHAARVELRMAVGDTAAGPAAGPVVLIVEPDRGADFLRLVHCRIHRLPEGLFEVEPAIHAKTRVRQSSMHPLIRHHPNLLAHRLRLKRPVPEPERRLAAHLRRFTPEREDLLGRRREESSLRRLRRLLPVCCYGRRAGDYHGKEDGEHHGAIPFGLAVTLYVHAAIVSADRRL
jgi:hypothetical protein